ncbi:MAG TPA: Fe-S oxidoreductase [Lachnospiraceae bacterium]|nr:Fe-S oxidoreductase [Lachnospiraceae bacterium]
MKLRIKFKKYGPIRFIGHLDVMRFFQKAIRRAGIDVAYSQGFSPHQIMAFAAPLGVGLTSNGEYMDIEVHSIISCQDVKERLNQVSVPGIEVTTVKVLPDNAENAMASVAAASYTVRFREGKVPETDIETLLPHFLAKERIVITKETKKGSREVDLKQGLYFLSCENGVLSMLVDASSGGNIKPVQVVEAILAEAGEKLQENALLITREEVYTHLDTESGSKLIPLDEIGTDEIPCRNA